MVVRTGGRGASRSLLGYLIERGLLDERDIVEGEVKVVDASRRNRNVRVTTTLGKNYFIKQALDEERSETIRREAAFLRFAWETAPGSRLTGYLPALRDWDAERGAVVFEQVPESLSLAEHQRRSRRWPVGLAGQAGAALAALHTWQPAPAPAAEIALPDYGPPWALSIHQPEIGIFDTMSGAGLEIVRIVQQAPSLGEALDRLRDGWRATAITHGDIKWDNFVVSRITGTRGRRLWLVDWELVQRGDPLWDAGSFLSQYLDTWIASIPVVDAAGLSRSPEGWAQMPLERLQPAMRRFWDTYARAVGLDGAGRSDALARVARYAAARLILTGVEAEQLHPQLNNTGVLRLQVAQNMLRRPAEAAAALFGITG
ncbi:MAG TPA: phosphotransferase [Thermomicrobiaceae bacterium]|nr:phosphotransferase [Thermomicrobiaceae bacterium]